MRQVALPQVGAEGQARLAKSSALVVGAGGLGCPVLQYLAATGVGHIEVVDGDAVEFSNLQRQPLYRTVDVGQPRSQRRVRRLPASIPRRELTRSMSG